MFLSECILLHLNSPIFHIVESLCLFLQTYLVDPRPYIPTLDNDKSTLIGLIFKLWQWFSRGFIMLPDKNNFSSPLAFSPFWSDGSLPLPSWISTLVFLFIQWLAWNLARKLKQSEENFYQLPPLHLPTCLNLYLYNLTSLLLV